VGVDLRSGSAQVVASEDAQHGLTPLAMEGDVFFWTDYERTSAVTTVRARNLATGQDVGSWPLAEGRTVSRLAVQGDLVVAEVAVGEGRRLFAWCLPDGTPEEPQGFRQETVMPELASWGGLVYLVPQQNELRLYHRPIGCGTVPTPFADEGFIPGPASVLAAAALVAAAWRRRRSAR
jgi:hypothetical protein